MSASVIVTEVPGGIATDDAEPAAGQPSHFEFLTSTMPVPVMNSQAFTPSDAFSL